MDTETIILGIGILSLLAYFVFHELGANAANPGDPQNVSSNGAASTLSQDQIQDYAAGAGFSGDDLATAVAVAMAESGGNANAYNPETGANAPQGKGSFGLWQIYLNAHPEYATDNLYDPATNASAAFAIYSAAGESFSPWSTFKSGAYQQFLSAASPVQTADVDQSSAEGSDTYDLDAVGTPGDSLENYGGDEG